MKKLLIILLISAASNLHAQNCTLNTQFRDDIRFTSFNNEWPYYLCDEGSSYQTKYQFKRGILTITSRNINSGKKVSYSYNYTLINGILSYNSEQFKVTEDVSGFWLRLTNSTGKTIFIELLTETE